MTIQGFRITNKGRAALIAMKENNKQDEEVPAHYRIADALAEAGLLAPELPDESWPQVWEVEGFLVAAIEDGGETIELAENEGDGNVGYGWFMDRRLARNLAYALLAAADYAEKMSQ